MAAKINWHRYGTKLRHCQPLCKQRHTVYAMCCADGALQVGDCSKSSEKWRYLAKNDARGDFWFKGLVLGGNHAKPDFMACWNSRSGDGPLRKRLFEPLPDESGCSWMKA